MAPISGPKQITNTAFPIMCHPKAPGSCSSVQYSDTHKVKLLNATPRKKPAMHNHVIKGVQLVSSAITGEGEEGKGYSINIYIEIY